MKIELNKNELAGALVALGKLICRTSPNVIYKAVQIEAKQNEITFRTCNQEESIEFRKYFRCGFRSCKASRGKEIMQQ